MGGPVPFMVEFTGVPYMAFMAAAALRRCCISWRSGWAINAYARRLFALESYCEAGSPGPAGTWLITVMFFLVPFSVLLVGMFIAQFTPEYSQPMANLVRRRCYLFLHGAADLSFHVQIRSRLAGAVSGTPRARFPLVASIILCASIIIGVLF